MWPGERILIQVDDKLEKITDDEGDEENLHRVNDEKTIKLFEFYQKLGNLMYRKVGAWDNEDHKNYHKYINAIMDFDCGDDANCKQYKEFFKDKSGIVHRPPKEVAGSNVIVGPSSFTPKQQMEWHGHGGRRQTKQYKKHSKQSKKSKSRRHSKKSRRH